MSYGITVIGDHGLYQIDENSFCLSVMETGSLTPPLYNSFTTTVNSPIFGLYIPTSSGYYGGITNTSLSGSTWTVTVQLFTPYSAGGSGTNISLVKWFVFGRPTSVSGGYGLEVFEPSGGLRFSSNWRTKTIAGGSDYIIDASKKYAIVGGVIQYTRNLDVELLTDNTFYFREALYASGYQSNNGGISQLDQLIFYNEGAGTGGGSTGSTTYGINQPAFAIDITEYV